LLFANGFRLRGLVYRRIKDSVVITKTSTDGFGHKKTVSKTQNADGSKSVSVTESGRDIFGNNKTVSKKFTDDGSVRCKTVSSRTTDSFGDSASRTSRRCAADF
jgi:hypothetical protein